MTNEIEIVQEHNGAFAMFDGAIKEVRKLDVIGVDTVVALGKLSMRTLAKCLQEQDIEGAIDVLDQVDTVDHYVRKLLRRGKTSLLAANTMSASHMDNLRFLGGYFDPRIETTAVPVTDTDKDRITRSDLERWNLPPSTVQNWRYLSRMPDEEYEAWKAPYLDGGVEKGQLLYIYHLITRLSPKSPSAPRTEASLELKPMAKLVWIEADKLDMALQSWVEEVSIGDTSQRQLVAVVEKLRKVNNRIIAAVQQNGELF